ncbi:flap endonuclease GEN-like 2-like, partial [Trifolium medium]|nr:flap endonuclease GEN-like 2-like [Trifolium medium]
IALSLLLGSDYYPGVHGLGPESACQIVKSIGDKFVLKKFAYEGLGWLKKRKGAENNIGRDDTIVEVINAYLKPKCHSADSDVVLR